eukprot:TRINITY_DN2311_c0_g1_i3.p4 TRINITY_DN2311_c0_g1~~TRINITY_DN2311_c0_g1_i3.p4  ORF type:complete len:121 (+),score=0.62 TRINITY_DN2311_c0_g1_i3:724-1086(+)
MFSRRIPRSPCMSTLSKFLEKRHFLVACMNLPWHSEEQVAEPQAAHTVELLPDKKGVPQGHLSLARSRTAGYPLLNWSAFFVSSSLRYSSVPYPPTLSLQCTVVRTMILHVIIPTQIAAR